MVARVQRQKRAGTYRRGMNLDDPEGDTGNDTKTSSKKSKKDVVCQFCQLVGHSTMRSKMCLQNPNRLINQQNYVQRDEDDDDEQDEEAQNSDDELDLFYDVGTWSDGEGEGRASSCFI